MIVYLGWPGQGTVCGEYGVVVIKSSDLEPEFELSIRHPGEDIELKAEVRAKCIHFGVINTGLGEIPLGKYERKRKMPGSKPWGTP